jgi:hypothetical protein
VASPSLDRYLRATSRSLDATYVTGFQESDTVFLAEGGGGAPAVCWTGVSGDASTCDEQMADLTFALPTTSPPPAGTTASVPQSSSSATSPKPSSRTPTENSERTETDNPGRTASCAGSHVHTCAHGELMGESASTDTQSDNGEPRSSLTTMTTKTTTTKTTTSTATTTTLVHGIAGYFTSTLHRSVVIDTCHTSKNFNSHHWEAFYFPLSHPVRQTNNVTPPALSAHRVSCPVTISALAVSSTRFAVSCCRVFCALVNCDEKCTKSASMHVASEGPFRSL